MYSDPNQAIVLNMRDGTTFSITHYQILEQHAMLTAFRHAANSIAIATGVTQDHVDHDEAAKSVTGDHYFLELIAEAEQRYKMLKNHSIPCPQHLTGVGPCWCKNKELPVAPEPGKPVTLRTYTLTTARGSRIHIVAQSLSAAIRMVGADDLDIVASKSEPWVAGKEQAL